MGNCARRVDSLEARDDGLRARVYIGGRAAGVLCVERDRATLDGKNSTGRHLARREVERAAR